MLVFPQLGTGASTLYPVKRQTISRTVVNTLGDGSTVVYGDADAASVLWELQAKGLTGAEWNALEAFFKSVSGEWQTFTFLDPAGNLLADSEQFTGGAWTNGALIQLTTGVSDPLGTSRAARVVNTGQAAQAVAQTLSVPGNFQYCLSVWARTDTGSSLTLTASTAGASTASVFPLTAQWRRISIRVGLAQSTASLTFGAQLDPGGSADLFGMQAEAQLAPSDYKMTGESGGVYPKARFASDGLKTTAQSADVYDANIRIFSAGN